MKNKILSNNLAFFKAAPFNLSAFNTDIFNCADMSIALHLWLLKEHKTRTVIRCGIKKQENDYHCWLEWMENGKWCIIEAVLPFIITSEKECGVFRSEYKSIHTFRSKKDIKKLQKTRWLLGKPGGWSENPAVNTRAKQRNIPGGDGE